MAKTEMLKTTAEFLAFATVRPDWVLELREIPSPHIGYTGWFLQPGNDRSQSVRVAGTAVSDKALDTYFAPIEPLDDRSLRVYRLLSYPRKSP